MENVEVNFWKYRNVFVTGATGLLGSWLTEELIEREANVVCLVRDWVPSARLIRSGLISRASVIRGELEDYELLLRILNEYEIDTVFHLGAQTTVGVASRSALSTFNANVRGTWNVLEACRASSRLIQRVAVASSDKAYGEHSRLPYHENTPLMGRFPYDASKACADMISFSYFHTYGVPVAVTRCGNLYGGGDLNFNRLIPGTIRSALQDQRPVIRSDGTFVRDYFYVRDAVKAYLLLAERLPDPTLTGEAFNFGNEAPVSVLEVVRELLSLMNKTHLQPIVLNEATHEIPRQYLSCSKARQMLNWQPAYTLADGLRETIAWYREHLGFASNGEESAARGGRFPGTEEN